jgi:hypothetical protein
MEKRSVRKSIEEDKEEPIEKRKDIEDKESEFVYTESLRKGKSVHKAMLKGRFHSDLNYDIRYTNLREEITRKFMEKATISDKDMVYYQTMIKNIVGEDNYHDAIMNIRTCFHESTYKRSAYFFKNIESMEKGGDASEMARLTKEAYLKHNRKVLNSYNLRSAYDPITADIRDNKEDGKIYLWLI